MSQLLYAPATIGPTGNIAVHGRAGFVLTYQRLVAGAAVDISGDALFFEIAGLSRVALSAGADVYTRRIIVEPATVALLPIGGFTPFALRDETNDPPVVRWDGVITARGFTAQPGA